VSYVVIEGTVVDGVTVHGTFPVIDDAVTWGAANCASAWVVAPLVPTGAERPPFPAASYDTCPECGVVGELVEYSPCEGIHSLSGAEDGAVEAAFVGHTDMGDGYIACRSCGTEWEWPDDMPELDYL
jgi:hypothetical protein